MTELEIRETIIRVVRGMVWSDKGRVDRYDLADDGFLALADLFYDLGSVEFHRHCLNHYNRFKGLGGVGTLVQCDLLRTIYYLPYYFLRGKEIKGYCWVIRGY